jgi:predicted acyl esterase
MENAARADSPLTQQERSADMTRLDPAALPSRPEFDVHLIENVLVSMRDGIRLATDVYLPARDGKPLDAARPVLLHRTPYNKTETETSLGHGSWFAARGYAVVDQDCRGCFRSEGDVNFLVPEAEDGADTIAWILRQPWCNGTIGSFGTSWSGWTQTAMAALGPKGLATMIPNMSGADAHESSVRHGGALELRFLAWAFWHSAYNSQAALTSRAFVVPGLNFGAPAVLRLARANADSPWPDPISPGPGLREVGARDPHARRLRRLLAPSEPQSPRALGAVPRHAMLFVGGWYDSYTRATFQNFVGLRAGGRRPVRALVGPWTHGNKTVELSYAGDVEFGSDAALASFDELHLRWFDRWLRGVDNGLDGEAPLRIFVMGGGSGRRSSAGRLIHGGPLARRAGMAIGAHALHGSLPSRRRLAPHRRAARGVVGTTYRFDPARPVPSIGGNVSSLRDVLPLPPGIVDPRYAGRGERTADVMRAGGFDQREAPDFHGCRPPYLPLARAGRPRLSNRAAGRSDRGYRARGGRAVGGHLRNRY